MVNLRARIDEIDAQIQAEVDNVKKSTRPNTRRRRTRSALSPRNSKR